MDDCSDVIRPTSDVDDATQLFVGAIDTLLCVYYQNLGLTVEQARKKFDAVTPHKKRQIAIEVIRTINHELHCHHVF